MLETIWGLKTHAIFDVWTIEHFLSGLSIGSSVMYSNHKMYEKKIGFDKHRITTRYFDVVGVLLCAYIWETIEHYLESGLVGQPVMYWFQGVEFWANRIISDPLMLVLGYLLVKKYPKLVIPARILSVLWLVTHIFIFPHSMYLHELF